MFLVNLLAEEGTTPTGCTTQQYIVYGVLFAILIGFFIWSTYSSKKRQKKEQEKLSSIKVGDKVKTIGGICGFITEINEEENTFVLETGDNINKSYVKFDKAAIYQTSSDTDASVNNEVSEVEDDETVKIEKTKGVEVEKKESTVDGKKID